MLSCDPEMEYPFQLRAPSAIVLPRDSHRLATYSLFQKREATRHLSIGSATLLPLSYVKSESVNSPFCHLDAAVTSLSAPGWTYSHIPSEKVDVVIGQSCQPKVSNGAGYVSSCRSLPSIGDPTSRWHGSFKPLFSGLTSSPLIQQPLSSTKLSSVQPTASFRHPERLSTQRHKSQPLAAESEDPVLETNNRPQSQQSLYSNLDLSSFLLSLFPLPPRNPQPPAGSSEGSRDLDEPQTPRTEHCQSASLDIFELYTSPLARSSRSLQDNATICEVLLQPQKHESLEVSRKVAAMSSTPLKTGDKADTNPQTTPGRLIYNDLASAYKEITSRPFTENVVVELPSPPIPQPSRARSHHSEIIPGNNDPILARPSPSHDPMSRSSQRPHSDNLTEHERFHHNFKALQPPEFKPENCHDDAIVYPLKSAPVGSLLSLTTSSSPKSHRTQLTYDDDTTSDKQSRASYDSHTALLQPLRGDTSVDFASYHESTSQADPKIKVDLPESKGVNSSTVQEKLRMFESRAVNAEQVSPLPRRHSDNTKFQVSWGTYTTTSVDNTIENLLEHYIHQSESSPTLTIRESAQRHLQTQDESLLNKLRLPKPDPTHTLSVVDRPTFLRSKKFLSLSERTHRKSVKTIFDKGSKESLVETLAGAPIVPLPDVPSDATKSTTSGPATGNRDAFIGSYSVEHGDTQALLKPGYSSSIELNRGVEISSLADHSQINHAIENATSSITTLEVSENNNNDVVMIDNDEADIAHQRLSYDDYEVETGNEHRLSQLSSVSNSDAARYILQQNAENQDEELMTYTFMTRDELDHERSRITSRGQPGRQNLNTSPIDSESCPVIWRLSVSDRTDLKSHGDSGISPSVSNAVKNEDVAEGPIAEESNDDPDWETIPGSRPRLRNSLPEEDSYADLSNCGSFNTIADVQTHPGDNRFQHSYRLQTVPHSNDQMLVPSYKFSGAVGFPSRNALVEPVRSNNSEPYRHPSPIPRCHTNPFTSSPPVVLSSPLSRFVATPSEADSIYKHTSPDNVSIPWHRRGLSVINEHASEGSHHTVEVKEDNKPSGSSLMRSNSDVSHSSGWISLAQDDEIVPENNVMEGSSFLSSGSNVRLMTHLRKNDPRMASTPLSTRNSFAKFAVFGPKVNITGTPNGTGMHEVGSSLVGSSSSPYQYSSSPLARQPSTPNTPASVLLRSAKSLRSGMMPSSPTGEFEERQYGIARNDYATQLPGPIDNFREAMLAASRFDSHSRRSVSSQTSLLEMSLMHDMSGTRNNSGVRFSPGLGSGSSPRSRLPEADLASEELWHSFTARGARDTEARRLAEVSTSSLHSPFAQNFMHARSVLFRMFGAEDKFGTPRSSSPHLFRLRRYQSPPYVDRGSRSRKNYLSWVVFAMCCILPPMLVVYSTSYLDAFMYQISQGEFDSFGKKQKKIARYVGVIATIVVCVGIAVVMIVIHKVPNNLP